MAPELKELEAKAERQLLDIEQGRDLFDVRNYISAMKARVEELCRVEVDYKLLRDQIHRLTQQVINGEFLLGSPRPFAPKLVETRGNGVAEGVSSGGDNFPLQGVERLDDPSVLRGPQGTVMQAQREAVVSGQSVEVEEVVSGSGIDELP